MEVAAAFFSTRQTSTDKGKDGHGLKIKKEKERETDQIMQKIV